MVVGEAVGESSKEELIGRMGENKKRRMSGFSAFFLSKILKKRVKTTEVISLAFLPPFKIHCEAGRRGTRDTHRERCRGIERETIESRVQEKDV